MSRAQLLRKAVSLVQIHGFTRRALSESVLSMPSHTEPLSETAVSALFGQGDSARRALINAWLEDGIAKMKAGVEESRTIRHLLHTRLKYNEPVLQHLPEAFALLAVSNSSLLPLDPRPALNHVLKIADEACYLADNTKSWYAHRASISVIYSSAELHQLVSPATAPSFLDSLLESSILKTGLDDVGLFSSYVVRSWVNIIKSKGFF